MMVVDGNVREERIIVIVVNHPERRVVVGVATPLGDLLERKVFSEMSLVIVVKNLVKKVVAGVANEERKEEIMIVFLDVVKNPVKKAVGDVNAGKKEEIMIVFLVIVVKSLVRTVVDGVVMRGLVILKVLEPMRALVIL